MTQRARSVEERAFLLLHKKHPHTQMHAKDVFNLTCYGLTLLLTISLVAGSMSTDISSPRSRAKHTYQ